MSTDKIKKFFSRKKDQAKFKLTGSLGQGRTLNAVSEPSSSGAPKKKNSKDAYVPPQRKELSNEAKTAAAAALARIEKKDVREFNTSLAAIKLQVKRELEAEKKLREETENDNNAATKSTVVAENKNLACQGVYFRCPLISAEIVSKKEWIVKIKEFLYQQLETEKGLTACLIIFNCNPREKAENCVEILKKYLENIINHPDEEKYHKIKCSNRIYCDKVRNVEGAIEFLQAAGFREQQIENEEFLVWSNANMEGDIDLTVLLDALENAEPIALELDRNIQVLLPSQARKTELPDDFYRISPEEIKREINLKAEALENAQMLKTKAMRDREEKKILNRYRYALIRIKFPDGSYLQGTFNVYEKMSDVYEFVQSCLYDESVEFHLIPPVGGVNIGDEDMEKSLYDLKLIPNTVLMFASEKPPQEDGNFLKEELLMLIQQM